MEEILAHSIYIGYVLLIITTITVVILENRQPAKTVAWVLAILVIPVVGWILFYFFGQNLRKERYIEKRALDKLQKKVEYTKNREGNPSLPQEYERLVRLVEKRHDATLTHHNEVEILKDGRDFLDHLLDDIHKAEHWIHLQTYIIEDDEMGHAVIEALQMAAKRNVEVRLMYDDVGCWKLPKRAFDTLRGDGGEAVAFMPVHFRSLTHRANYRNHRKTAVVDGHTAYIGGMNLAKRYLSLSDGVWRDAHIKIQGEAAHEVNKIFLTDWYFATGQLVCTDYYFPKTNITPRTAEHGVNIQIIAANPVAKHPVLMYALTWIIQNAQRYIYIQTPYFMPTESVLQALRTAALSGVDVRVMIPEKPDALLLRWGNESYIEDVIQAGVGIYVYRKGFLHSKCAVADDYWCTIGSSNMDQRSFDNNFEANAFIYNPNVAQQVKDIFYKDMEDCWQIQLDEWKKRPILRKVMASITRIISPIL